MPCISLESNPIHFDENHAFVGDKSYCSLCGVEKRLHHGEKVTSTETQLSIAIQVVKAALIVKGEELGKQWARDALKSPDIESGNIRDELVNLSETMRVLDSLK